MEISTNTKDRTLLYAAQELCAYLKKITGTDCEINSSENADIRLSLMPEGSVKNTMTDDRYQIDIKNGKGTICASNKRSVLLGVYKYLKELGCRFVRPGELGEVIPEMSLQGTHVKLDESAFYPYRIECIEGSVCEEFVTETIKWLPKAGFNAFFIQGIVPYNYIYRWYAHESNPYKESEDLSYEHAQKVTAAIEDTIRLTGLQFHDVGHAYTFEPFGMHYLTSWAHQYRFDETTRPFVALVNGKRDVMHGSINFTNICYSNPEAIKLICDWFVSYMKEKPYIDFLHIYLADTVNNHCECEACQKTTVSDLYVDMLNAIDKAFTENDINCTIVSAQYTHTRYAPLKSRFKNPERFLLMPCIQRLQDENQYDGVYDKDLPANLPNKFVPLPGFKANMALFDGWKKICDRPYFFFEYHLYSNHYFDQGYMSVSRELAEDIKKLRDYGSEGMLCCKTQRCYMPTALPSYCGGALLFNPDLKFDTVADEYFEASFGKRAPEAREYLEKLSNCFSQDMLRVYVDVYQGGDGDRAKSFPKWINNSEAAALFKQIEPHVENFEKNVDAYIRESENNCVKRSFELLKYHAPIAKLYGKALVEGAKGNLKESKAHFEKLFDHIAQNEDNFAPEFDLRLFVIRMGIVIKSFDAD